ncbi:hypothetical protein GCK72_023524 [Caenorhabditis remanei]|uniref:DUF38 domain-containing protein n=1 Tax=Caenorhabditis remanei TaxID=31234 RepID=A0A6A5FX39_CAERE|nr:hypothetical protein GCK72_023524 [Caenorhabditis remanei]KAF1747065.1 hypothetical protein GCK72_023524 [Caenorhabditis remanei]
MKAFHSDLEILLKNQKPASEPMSLDIQIDNYEKLNQNRVNEQTMNRLIETFLTELKQVLTSRAEIFLIGSLFIDVLDQKHVMLVLPFLYPETLETLWLSNAYKNHDDRTLEMNVIVQIEHWKNIEEFYVEGLVVNASVRNFAHISRLKTKIMTVTAGDLIFLKELRYSFYQTYKTTKYSCNKHSIHKF